MKLFHAPRSRSTRVLWLCEELGIEMEVVPASLTNPTAEFLALNPSNTVPVFVDGDTVMTESLAILMYLAKRHGPTPLLVRSGEPAFPDFLQFFILGEAGLLAPLNAAIGTKFSAPDAEKDNFTNRAIAQGFGNRVKLVERQLEKHQYMAADRFTLADISVAFAIGVGASFLGFPISATVADYQKRMTERPAFGRAAAR